MTKRKTNGYEAGKLASDIAYIKAGIVDLQEKTERFVEFRIDSEKRSETNTARIVGLEGSMTIQAKRVDDVLKEGRITTFIGTALAAVVGVMFGPKS